MSRFLAPVAWGRIEQRADNVIILGSGPSMTQLDLDVLLDAQRKGAYVITVNDAGYTYVSADAWFTLDPHNLAERLPPIRGQRWIAAIPDNFGTPSNPFQNCQGPCPAQVLYLNRLVGHGPLGSKWGLCEDPGAIYTGNSAYGALGVAYLMKAKRIALLGVDGTSGYFYNATAPSGNLSHLPQLFESAKPQLDARGTKVFNGSPYSVVECWPRMAPNDAIKSLFGDA